MRLVVMGLQQLALGFGPGQASVVVSSRRSAVGDWGNFSTRPQQQQRAWRRRTGDSRVGQCRCLAGGPGVGAAAGVVEIVEKLNALVLGVGVGLPCQVMDCGDVVYRSTLPKQGLIITAPGVFLAVLIATYLWAQPGVAPGFWDMFVLAKLERIIRPSYKKVGPRLLAPVALLIQF